MPKIDFTYACLLLKGHKCCVLWTLEGSPCYRDGSCAICTGQASPWTSLTCTYGNYTRT